MKKHAALSFRTIAALAVALLPGLFPSASAAPALPGSKPIVSYYWHFPIQSLLTNPTALDFFCSNVTHIVAAPHPIVNADGTVTMSATNLTTLSNVVSQLHARGVGVFLEGLITAPGVSWPDLLRSPSARATYVQSLVQFCQSNQVDGVDYDWEYPTSADLPYFTLLLRDLRVAAPPGFKIVSPAATWYASVPAEAEPYVDWIMPQTYSFGLDTNTLPNWVTWGYPKSKLLLGVGFYANEGSYAAVIGTNNVDPSWDSITNNGVVWRYNGVNTVKRKTEWVYTNGFGGVMTFDLCLDVWDHRSLSLAIADQARILAFSNAVFWSGGGNGTWTSGANWLGGTAPAATKDACFGRDATNQFVTVLGGNRTVNSLMLYDVPAPITIGGDTLTLGAGGLDMQWSYQNLTLNSAVGLNANQTWTVSHPRTCTVNGVVSGGSALTLAGGGTLALTTTNTYTGNTVVARGVLDLTTGGIYSAATKTGTDALVVSGGGVLAANRWGWGADQSLGYLNFNNGYLRVDAGTLRNTAATSTDWGGPGNNRAIVVSFGGVTIENASAGTTWSFPAGGSSNTYGGDLRLTGVGDGNFSQLISGTNAVVKSGSGAWTLGGTNTYSGGTIVRGGSLRASGNAALGSGEVTVNNGGNIWFNPTQASPSALNYTNVINLSSGGALYAGPAAYTTLGEAGYVAQGAVTNCGDLNLSGTATIASSARTPLVFAGQVSGTGTLVISNTPGAMPSGGSPNSSPGYSLIRLTNPTNDWTGGMMIWNGNGTAGGAADANLVYAASLGSGPIQLGSSSVANRSGGFLYLTAANAINPDSTVAMYDNTSSAYYSQFDLNGHSQTIAGLISAGGGGTAGQHCKVLSASGSPTLTISNNGDYSFNGVLSSGLNLVKAGTGRQTLTNVNTYSGTTTVRGGALLVNSPGALTTSVVTVTNGGTLGGDGTFNAPVVALNGGLLSPGRDVYTIGAMNLAASGTALNLNGARLLMHLLTNAAPTCDLIALTGPSGTLQLDGTNTLTLLSPFGLVPAGTYTLMTYAAKTGSGTLVLDRTYTNATLNVGATSVTLTVTGGGTSAWGAYVWRGDGLVNAWNTTTPNWLVHGSGATYANGGNVILDDSGWSAPAITIPAGVTPGTVSVNSAKDYTLQGGAVSGSSLGKFGSGTLTLLNNNSYSGTTISNGVVQVGNGSTNGSLTGSILNHGQLIVSRSDAVVLAGPITGTGSLQNQGTGSLSLAAGNGYSGGTVASAGSLRTAGNGSFGSGAVNVNSNANVWFNPTQFSSTALNYSNALILNDGAAIYAGPATYTTPGEAGYKAQGPVTNHGPVSIAGNVTLASSAQTRLAFAGPISGSGGITVTYTPGAMGSGAFGNAGYSRIYLTNPTNSWTGGLTILHGNGAYNGGASEANFVYASSLGSGPIQLGPTSGSYRPGGFLYLTAANAIKPGSTVMMYDNTANYLYSQLDLNGFSQTIAGLGSAGFAGTAGQYCKVLSASGSPTLTISNTGDYTFRGVISSGLNLVKAGAGTQTLTNAQTYTGTTTVDGGTLEIAGPGSLAAGSAVTVNGGGTLGGNGTINGTVSVAGGTVAPGTNGNAVGTLALANAGLSALNLTNATVLCDLLTNATPASDRVAVAGRLNLSGTNVIQLSTPLGIAPAGTYTLMTYASRSGSGTLTLDRIYPNATLNVGATSVTLTVTGAGTYDYTVWKGDGAANVWDTVTPNWAAGSGPMLYSDGSSVTFDDTGSSLPAVNIIAPVSPGAVRVSSANDYTFGGAAITGNGRLTKSGSGTLTLAGVNTYSGDTVINEGKLAGMVGGALPNSAVTVNAATFSVLVADNTKRWTGTNLTFNAGATLDFNFGWETPSPTVAPLLVSNVTFAVTPTIMVQGGNLPAGAYPLMIWTNGITSGSAPTTTNLVLPPRITGALSVSGSTLWLTVSGNTGPLKWGLAGDGTWDINTSQNWKDNSSNAAYYLEPAQLGDQVVFDDTYIASGSSPVITLNTTVTPASVSVNSTNPYTISGNGGIDGDTGLLKAGTNTLTLGVTNSYSEGTTVSAGSLRTSVNEAFGSGAVMVGANANLWFNPTASSTDALNYANSLILSNGATLYAGMVSTTNGDPAYTAKGPVTNCGPVNISGTVTFASSATTRLAFSGSISGSGTFVVSVVPGAMGNGAWGTRGYSRIYLTNPTNSWTGGTTILKGNGAWSQGLADANAVYAASLGSGPIQLGTASDTWSTPGFLYLTAANAINPASTVLMYDNTSAQPAAAELNLNGYSQTIAGLTSLGANGTAGQYCKVLSASGSPTLTISNSGDYTFRGVITTGLNLVKSGAGTQTLTNAQTYTGSTTVNGGTLMVNGSLSTNTVTVSGGGMLAGRGMMNGSVRVNSGGVLSPGTNVNAIGTMTLANTGAMSLNLSNATVLCNLSTNTTPTSDLATVAGTLNLDGANVVSLTTPLGTAPAGTYTLMTYASRSGSGTLTLDHTYPNASLNVGPTNVTLTVTASGLSVGVSVAGGGMVAPEQFGLNFTGPFGQPFRVLGTNLLAAPMAAWPVLMNGIFGVGGPAATNFIDTRGADSMMFYRIQSP